ncbi:SusC/RagA family TonB-linked outer membrane protein [Bacteroidia bacterium]|nr:SusC/RagA family TonB-linked outer membrane protein [Bacteroidia bacterium]
MEKTFRNFANILLIGGVLITGGVANHLKAESPQEAKIAVTGVVSDADGPVIGASVVEKGNPGNGVATDVDGKYSLRVSPSATIAVAYLGYSTKEVPVNGQTTINVTLAEDVGTLDEVVVVGFGTQKKVNLTGAISTVSAEAFESRPVSNIGQALQGLVPNLNISIAKGELNETPKFNIRGGTTMSYNTDDSKWQVDNGSPLIIVDGVELDETMLNQMNPNDIDAMSVIKDASAAAIYGTKATFGVILITTKSGKFNQKGKINYSYELSYDTPTALPDIMNALEIQQASMNMTRWTLGTPSALDEQKLEAIKKYMANPTDENRYFMNGSSIVWVGNMNPYKEVVRDWTPTQKHNLSVSGGSDKMTYYVSLGYQGEEGMYKIQTDSRERYNGTVRVNTKVKDWFNIEGKVSYNKVTFDGPYIPSYKGNIWNILQQDADKNINMPIKTGPNDPIPNTYTDNFLGWVDFGARTTNTRQTAVLSVSPEFIIIPKVLKVRADMSYTPQTYRANRRVPEHRYVTYNWGATVSEVSETTENQARLEQTQTDTYLLNAYAEFNKTFAEKHNVSAVLGFSQEKVDYSQLVENLHRLFSPDIQNPAVVEDIALNTMETGGQIRTGRSVFGRINYNYAEKYLFEMNGRQDGSSRFTPNERYFFFPSFSAGWRISEESFMAPTKDYLSNLKVRASWGKLGSQPELYYPYQATMTSESASYWIDGQYVTKVKAPNLISPTLTWEKAETSNFGVDAGFLDNRLNASFEVYRRTTTDILVEGTEAYPNTLGTAPPRKNAGSIEANGWELTLQWTDRLANGLRYNAGFNLADARTKVLSFPSNPEKLIDIDSGNGTTKTLYEGAYVGDIWGYETGGILQAEDLELNSAGTGYNFYAPKQQGTNYYPGDIWFRDLNGDGLINGGSNTVNNSGDRRIIGNNTPRYRYNITGGASWMGLDASIFFSGVGARDVWTNSYTYWGSTQNGAGSKWMNEQAWQPDRTNAKFPRYLGTNNKTPQTGYLMDGSYLRLKQAVVGYTLPSKLTAGTGIEKVRLSLAGYNLFEITDVPTVFDPDQISAAYPSKRTVAFSAQITF